MQVHVIKAFGDLLFHLAPLCLGGGHITYYIYCYLTSKEISNEQGFQHRSHKTHPVRKTNHAQPSDRALPDY